MSLVNLEAVLKNARRQTYAVGSFNVTGTDMVRPILEAARDMNSPVIVSVAQVHMRYLDLEEIAHQVKYAAERALVPVVFHLDHGLDFETVIRAIRAGFTSVMFDGSTLPYEENVAQTREIVRIAHSVGVSVEAELGHVVGGEGTSGPTEADPSLFTDPDQAADFVQRTGIDALAPAFGSVHGYYKGEPKLDFARLHSIRDKVDVPLVLHGGSGISDSDFRKAIEYGINKVNVFTELSGAAVRAAKEFLTGGSAETVPALVQTMQETIKGVVANKIRVFCSKDRAGSLRKEGVEK